MNNKFKQEKDLFLIAHQIKKQSNQKIIQDQDDEQTQAKKILTAYRKVENIKTIDKKPLKQKQRKSSAQKHAYNQQNKSTSTYSNKIKQTLRQLNANKAKQYEKMKQNNKRTSQKQINMEINPSKSEKQRQLVLTASRKIFQTVIVISQRKKKQIFSTIQLFQISKLNQDYTMAQRYRLFRLFSVWKQQASRLKLQNQKQRRQQSGKQTQSLQMAKQFHSFILSKKCLKGWNKFVKKQKKKVKYEKQIIKAEIQEKLTQKKILIQQQHAKEKEILEKKQSNSELQGKLRGFLDGLKNKIENKNKLHIIKQKTQQSEMKYLSSSRNQNSLEQQSQLQNLQNNDQIAHQQQQDHEEEVIQNDPKKPLSNQDLEKKRKEIAERSKNRRLVLQKLKKQKQNQRIKQQQERNQLQKLMEEEQKQIKQQQYRQFQKQKQIQKQWQEKQKTLLIKAYQFNQMRLKNYFGVKPWKQLKQANRLSAIKLSQVMTKIMIRNVAPDFVRKLEYNMNQCLQQLYGKCKVIHDRNLKKKTLHSFKIQQIEMKNQAIQLQAFHQVHSQKIFFSLWNNILDTLRLQNIEEERPLIKRANQYRKINLLMKTLNILKQNATNEKKQKHIEQQKVKIKSKIKNIIAEKIEINYDDFL